MWPGIDSRVGRLKLQTKCHYDIMYPLAPWYNHIAVLLHYTSYNELHNHICINFLADI